MSQATWHLARFTGGSRASVQPLWWAALVSVRVPCACMTMARALQPGRCDTCGVRIMLTPAARPAADVQLPLHSCRSSLPFAQRVSRMLLCSRCDSLVPLLLQSFSTLPSSVQRSTSSSCPSNGLSLGCALTRDPSLNDHPEPRGATRAGLLGCVVMLRPAQLVCHALVTLQCTF